MEIEFDALLRTVAFLRTPHVLEVMRCLAQNQPPHQALPDADPDLIDAAVQQLLDKGAASPTTAGLHSNGRPVCPVTLTQKGNEILRLVSDLDWPLAPAESQHRVG